MNTRSTLAHIFPAFSMLGAIVGLVGCVTETEIDSEAASQDIQPTTQSLTAAPTVTNVRATIDISPNDHGGISATCPLGTLTVGAGYNPATPQLVVFGSSNSLPASWLITAYNNDTKTRSVDVFAMCLANAGTSTTRRLARKNLAAHSSGCVAVTCPTGTIPVGGGFAFPGLFPSGFVNYGTTNGWNACGTNSTNTPYDLDVGVTCLSGATGTVTNRVTTMTVPAHDHGVLTSSCKSSELLVSGGFENDSTLYNAASYGNPYSKEWYNIVYNDTSKPAIAAGAARCLQLN